MDRSLGADNKRPRRISRDRAPTTVHALHHDILCTVFASLDIFDLANCSLVCRSWSAVINKSRTFRSLYCKRRWMGGVVPEKPLSVYLEKTAMYRHRRALREGPVWVDHLKGHLVGGEQCRKKMGLLLTGGSEKLMRLWSLESYKCVGEFPIPDKVPLVDFDFDESKIVGLVGMSICIWKRNGLRRAFPSHEGTFSQGSCIRYCDPEAVVGCEDGTVRVFDMYSRKSSLIIRTRAGPITCLGLTDNHLILSGSSLGNITVSGLTGGERVGNLTSACRSGIRTLCFNPSSHLVFAGSATGYALCWDLRTMSCLWETRVSPNILYSVQHLGNDTSTLAVGGVDGVLRLLNQNTGKVISRCVLDGCVNPWASKELGAVQIMKGRRLTADTTLDSVHTSRRPPIRSMAVGMKKVITTHSDKHIRVWNFD